MTAALQPVQAYTPAFAASGTALSLAVGVSPGRGRGVFAAEFIPAGALIESCPLLILTPEESRKLERTALVDFVFEWIHAGLPGKQEAEFCDAVVLGYGMLYNHSGDPNAEIRRDYDRNAIHLIALKDIPAGAEIYHDYKIDCWPDD